MSRFSENSIKSIYKIEEGGIYIPNKMHAKPTIRIEETRFSPLVSPSKTLKMNLSYTTLTHHYKNAILKNMKNTGKAKKKKKKKKKKERKNKL